MPRARRCPACRSSGRCCGCSSPISAPRPSTGSAPSTCSMPNISSASMRSTSPCCTMTASTSKASRMPMWCWSASRALRRRRLRSISPIAASRPATCRWCRACRWRREVEKLTRPLVVGLFASPERIVQIRENRLLGPQSPPRRRPIYRQDGGGRGGRVFAAALRQAQLAVDRRDPALDRGNRRRGDEAFERTPPPAGDLISSP